GPAAQRTSTQRSAARVEIRRGRRAMRPTAATRTASARPTLRHRAPRARAAEIHARTTSVTVLVPASIQPTPPPATMGTHAPGPTPAAAARAAAPIRSPAAPPTSGTKTGETLLTQ